MFSLAASLVLFCQLGATLASPAQILSRAPVNRALYFLDNNASGNFIASVEISAQNGSLSSATKISTGGKGLAGLIAVSQDSVVVSGQYLFSVNAGSNTLSMFTINPQNPLKPDLVGKPAATLGHTPVSVAYSKKLNTVCVLNSGNVAGVTCYSVDPAKGLTALGPLRSIPQTEDSDPTKPPPGPLVLGLDITFNPSSTALFVSIRSNGGLPGLIYAWPVKNGKVGTNPVVSSLPGIVFPFSLNFINDSDSTLLVTNPHFNSQGAVFLDISSSLKATESKNVTIPGQMASCWIAYAPKLDTAFAMDALRNTISTLDLGVEDVTQQFKFPTPTGGAFDAKVNRHYLYSLTGPFNSTGSFVASPQVIVFDVNPVKSGKVPHQIQSYNIFNAIGKIPDAMGLAIYPSAE